MVKGRPTRRDATRRDACPPECRRAGPGPGPKAGQGQAGPNAPPARPAPARQCASDPLRCTLHAARRRQAWLLYYTQFPESFSSLPYFLLAAPRPVRPGGQRPGWLRLGLQRPYRPPYTGKRRALSESVQSGAERPGARLVKPRGATQCTVYPIDVFAQQGRISIRGRPRFRPGNRPLMRYYLLPWPFGSPNSLVHRQGSLSP